MWCIGSTEFAAPPSAEQWGWSSYPITAGMVACPKWFDRKWLLKHFGNNQKTAIRHYLLFVADGVQQSSPWSMLTGQIFLGSESFVERIQEKLAKSNIAEIPTARQRPKPKTLNEYRAITNSRDEAIVLAYRSGGYTLQQIGRYFSIHYSTVSRIFHQQMHK